MHLPNKVPWPDPSDLPRLAAAAAEALSSRLAMFTARVDRTITARHPYGTLRVPLGVIRVIRTGVTWVPQSLGEYNIGETGGMLTAIHPALCRIRSANQPMSPRLVDFDIYYRLL